MTWRSHSWLWSWAAQQCDALADLQGRVDRDRVRAAFALRLDLRLDDGVAILVDRLTDVLDFVRQVRAQAADVVVLDELAKGRPMEKILRK